MTPFYSRTGDDGFTGLLGEGRVPKYHPRTEAIGAIDEATAALGMARALSRAEQTGPLLLSVQRDLYSLMSEIAATPENVERFRWIDATKVAWLEQRTDEISAITPMPKEFIIPGDSPSAAAMSVARTVVRRAERQTAQLLHDGYLENTDVLRYLNRLSSLCFALELLETRASGKATPTLAKGNTP